MTCIVLGDVGEEHAVHMTAHLRRLGHDVEILDSRWFPASASIEWEPSRQLGSLIFPHGRRIYLSDVRSVYWRQYFGVAAAELPDANQSFIAQNDSRSLFESILIQLPTRWINGWRGFQLHQTKPAALSIVAGLGVPVPATLCTNDPNGVKDFVARYTSAIFKPVQGGAHARRMTKTHLDEEHLANLRIAPVTLQEEIRGRSVRVFVAGERVLGCELHTDELDYRDSHDVQITPCELKDDFQKTCIRISRQLDLIWTGMDFIRTGEGRFVFLEANPSPMFLGFEEQTGLPLTDSLAALLIAG